MYSDACNSSLLRKQEARDRLRKANVRACRVQVWQRQTVARRTRRFCCQPSPSHTPRMQATAIGQRHCFPRPLLLLGAAAMGAGLQRIQNHCLPHVPLVIRLRSHTGLLPPACCTRPRKPHPGSLRASLLQRGTTASGQQQQLRRPKRTGVSLRGSRRSWRAARCTRARSSCRSQPPDHQHTGWWRDHSSATFTPLLESRDKSGNSDISVLDMVVAALATGWIDNRT